MDTLFIHFVEGMQGFSAEVLAIFTFLACVGSILFVFRLFGATGLYLYNAVAVIGVSIQVLKAAPFLFSPEPVALGTVAFATTYLVTDILTEHYGKSAARKGVWLSFSAHILMTLLMMLTLGYAVVPEGEAAHAAMATLFAPSPRLLFAGLVAFLCSQFLDISLFEWVGRLTARRWLWLRANVATLISGLVDNAIFSVLAWVILSPSPIGLHKLIFTYILGTYFARVLVSFLSTPVMYLSYWCLPNPIHSEEPKPQSIRKSSSLLTWKKVA